MDDLTYTLRQLCQRNRDGSHATQADRLRTLTLVAQQLRELGFRQMRASSLKGKHVEALLTRWQTEGLAAGTQKNRVAHIRWWAEKVGKAGIIPADNAQLAIPDRQFVTNEDKARCLGDGLSRIFDVHVLMSLGLQEAFGLRREEAIKFQPSYADRADHIALKGSWTKGGRPRTIPITTPEQRVVLDQARRLAGAGSLIPAHKSYIQQRNLYDGLQGLGSVAMPAMKVFSMLPRAAEAYRRQIALGLKGEPRATLKARSILRELFGGEIRLVPQPDGGLTAHWNLHISALLRQQGSDGSGGRIL